MKHVRLGKTELQVSKIGFGGIPIMQLSMDEAVRLIKHCYELGITFYDTANMYFSSEEKIGKALGSVRDKVVIATKTTERKEKEATAHIDLSLRQLDTDWIDIYQLHNISNQEALDQVIAPGGAMDAVFKARESGKIRHVGLSSHNIQTAMDALETGLFETIQFPFNFIEIDPLDELFPLAKQKDMGIIGMKPLGGGLLERADLCFRYLQQHPYVMPIPGFKTTDEADEVIALYRNRKDLSDADRKGMQEIRSILGEKFCHRCEYCLPCDQGIYIPGVLIFPSAAKRLSRDAVSLWLGDALKGVDACIECGECQEKCPYDLPIIDLLKENQTLYKQWV
jgi:predicted aldo/keto reductase-like oxidoreductase